MKPRRDPSFRIVQCSGRRRQPGTLDLAWSGAGCAAGMNLVEEGAGSPDSNVWARLEAIVVSTASPSRPD